MEQKPSLFGIAHSNRNISKPDSWGKNKFNSTFPASLIAYMDSVGKNPVYLKCGFDVNEL
ncbi:MAG: HindVP family restriction endonuclease [Bacteroidetes bacterium]|nr:HindVP family restriction endonuclease [Bacteroidota bacterium]